MNALFAAGLFDNPWIVAVVVIGGAIANWVSKRRQEKQARHQSEGEEPPPVSSAPPGEFNLEETLRRLMGEEPPTPTPAPPPHIPRAASHELPPVQTRAEIKPLPPEWMRQPARPAAPALQPPIAVTQTSVSVRAAKLEVEQAEQRFEQLTEQVRHAATVITHTRQRPMRSGSRSTSRWRDVRSVRRAFVASLVFAPPKSFEP